MLTLVQVETDTHRTDVRALYIEHYGRDSEHLRGRLDKKAGRDTLGA